MPRYERLDGGGATLVLALDDAGAPRLLHFGARLDQAVDPARLDAALQSGPRGSTPDERQPMSIFPTSGFGFVGAPALAGLRQGGDGAIAWSACAAHRDGQRLEITLRDARLGLRAVLDWTLHAETGILSAQTNLHNESDAPFLLNTLAALALPLPAWASEIFSFSGDWAREQRPERFAAPPGVWTKINRTGRTGFAGATMLAVEPGADDERGRMIALHLAWSGNHQLAIETAPDGARQAQLAALIAPGEIALAPGEAHATPRAYACFSAAGFNGVSDRFHPFVRRAILPARAATPRRVHFNSWEGVYFDFDVESLKALAASAAALGVERFVLDDGWFVGRRNDRAALGDWDVDRARFPDGLKPLIDHVHGLGMDFGLWIEPEMISPDSALYRAHPDWCVHAPGAPRPTMRNQLWLDLAREEVRAHVFAKLNALLAAHEIAYLKWDCNRFLYPDTSGGRPAAQAITRGVYALMDELQAAHPRVEIESCASGGARIDLEILRRTSRVWASDTTDAVERVRIQRWASLLLPLETIGAHVGASPNHITGRRLAMDFRARIAMFAHMGVELDPRTLSDRDRETLQSHISLYRAHRALLHSGRHARWTGADGAEGRIVIAADGSEALALAIQTGAGAASDSAPLHFPGLDAAARYAVSLVPPWPRLAARRLADAQAWRAARIFDGAILGDVGLRLPLTEPETAWLIHFRRV